ncbi:MAG: acyltransferase domain-containing protein [Myxococcales bacterium]|nr:acyltransferase domain-containing protein [Myxococcales bacterium]
MADTDLAEAVAVIGLAGRFPGAADVEEFWRNLAGGVESITRFSDDQLAAAGVDQALRRNPRYVAARGVLADPDCFDAAFFGMSPREAEVTDPQHRLFLECAWEVLERAGYDPARASGAIGLFAGAGNDGYLVHHLVPNRALMESIGGLAALLGNEKDHLTTRVAYKLGLRGPAITVQTACSTSLVAIHLACQSLLSYQCDLALAGGVSIGFPIGTGYLHQDGHILSPDGHCRAFDARAQGTVAGDAVGLVAIKRLSEAVADRDHVHAVIRGSAVNNDGSHKVGYTAPSIDGQAEVIALAQAVAGVDPSTIGYLEAHGTGTALGDPIEIAALTQAFRRGTARRGFCAIGSIKSNVGHLNTAAGVASLIKTALSLEHRQLPPTLHFTAPNPEIDFAASPFRVNTVLRPWPASEAPRRAGVSSFGFGGTNAHAVLEEAPLALPTASSRPFHLLVLSARSAPALDAATARLRDHLAANPTADLADAAFTLQVGRRAFEHRRAVACRDVADAVGALDRRSLTARSDERAADRPVALLFPGQGAQHVAMAAELYRCEAIFREEVDRCCALLEPHLGLDLRRWIDPGGDRVAAEEALGRTEYAQPALFTIEYALARTWIAFGVRPCALLGHSLGEYVAACLAEVFTLEDALALVAARGRLMQALPAGAMIAVPVGEEELRALLPQEVSVAAVNAPASCVASGPPDAIAELERRLASRGLSGRRLRTSHAFHSSMMDSVLVPFTERVRAVRLSAPKIPFLSNLTGTFATAAEAINPAYWARQMRGTVRFSSALEALLQDTPVLLEVGPGRTLAALAAQHRGGAGAVTSLPPPLQIGGDAETFTTAVGRLWLEGVPIDWPAVHAREPRRRVPLPTYPFERRRFWIDPPRAVALTARETFAVEVACWQPAPPPADPGSLAGTRWLLLCDEAGHARALADRLRARGAEVHAVGRGPLFLEGETGWTVDPRQRDDLDALLDRLRSGGLMPSAVLRVGDLGASSLLALLQALGRQHLRAPLRLALVTDGLVAVAASEPAPRAELLGLCEVIPFDLPDVACRCIDITGASLDDPAFQDRLVAEIASGGGDPLVALRGGDRLLPTLGSASPPSAPHPRPEGGWLVLARGPRGRAVARSLKATGAPVVLLEAPPRTATETATATPTATEAALDAGHLDSAEGRIRSALAIRSIETYPELVRTLETLCAAYLHRYFVAVGVDLRPGATHPRDALRARLGILPKFHRLHDAHLAILVEAGLLRLTSEEVQVRADARALPAPEALLSHLRANYPQFGGLVRFLTHCAPTFADALSGKVEAISVLYPGGSSAFIAECERATVEHRSERLYILLLREAILGRVRAAPGRRLRILEIGGGQGALTWPLALALRGEQVDYHFTDLGKVFVDDARREAARRGLAARMTFGLLDISRDPREQGYEGQRFDAVVAFNVVHAARSVPRAIRNLGNLLAPGGVMGLVEVVRTRRWDTLTWGLAEGWWYYDDDVRTDSPLLDLNRWEEVLKREGFAETLAWPRGGPGRAASDHGLLLARRGDGSAPPLEPALEGVERRTADTSGLARAWDEAARGGSIPCLVDALDLDGDNPAPLQINAHVHDSLEQGERRLGALATLLDQRPGAALVLLSPAPGFATAIPSSLRHCKDAFARARSGVISATWDGFTRAISDPSLAAAALESALAVGAPVQVWRSATPRIDEPALAPVLASEPRLAEPSPAPVHVRPSLAGDYVAPRSAIERAIAAIGEELLGVAPIGIHDDFLALGADSLITLRLLDQVREKLGREVPPGAAFQGTTVAKLARAIEGTPGAAPSSPLVPIQPHGTRPPLYFVHPAAGVIFPYYELARQLGPDQPFHGLQALGLDGESAPDHRIEDMARHYVEAIRTVQPRGPYHIGGFSFGCLVAFEMAQQLAAAGEEVALLALVDEPAPLAGHRPPALVMARLLVIGMARSIWPHLHDYFYLRSTTGGPTSGGSRFDLGALLAWRPDGQILQSFLARSTMANYVPREARLLALRQPAILPMFQLFMIHLRQTLEYVPRAYPQRVTLFKANRLGGRYDRDPTWGWRLLAAGGVEVHEVPGKHLTVLRPPHVQVLAARLTAAMDDAVRRRS